MYYVQLYGTTVIYNSTGTTIIWEEIYMIWITRMESTWSRVVCYWNTGEGKERQLKYNTERIRETSQTMQLNREIKWGKLNIMKREIKNPNKIKVVKIMKK